MTIPNTPEASILSTDTTSTSANSADVFPATTKFFYVSCQHLAETKIKSELCQPNGPFRLAYSQKGFVTLKSELEIPIWSNSRIVHPLVRCSGQSLGSIKAESAGIAAKEVLAKARDMGWQELHVWQRDTDRPGTNRFEPGRSELAEVVAETFRAELSEQSDSRSEEVVSMKEGLDPSADNLNGQDKRRVLEVVLISPSHWNVSARIAQNDFDLFPGGVPRILPTEEPISRAYLKLADAIAWSGFEISGDKRCVEIGSAPGGACQFLLQRGASVVGIDAAEMDARVLQHPKFEHWRSKSQQVKRKMFSGFDLLLCDANVTPNYTLTNVGNIVSDARNDIAQLILTLKLSNYDILDSLPSYLDQIRSWGYSSVKARQLAHSGREMCVVAQR